MNSSTRYVRSSFGDSSILLYLRCCRGLIADSCESGDLSPTLPTALICRAFSVTPVLDSGTATLRPPPAPFFLLFTA